MLKASSWYLGYKAPIRCTDQITEFSKLHCNLLNLARTAISEFPSDNKALYRAVQNWISYKTLRKVEEQRQLQWKDPLISSTCIGTFIRVYGLPYVYILHDDQPLRLEDFHSHWRLICDGVPLHLLES